MPGGIRVPMPVGRWVRQRFDASHVHDLPGTVRRELDRSGIAQAVRPGRRIAIAAGSRGIAHLAEIIGAVVEEVRRRGAAPFIVPAMGSHGGATPEGQRRILAELGIDEARTGCPVVSSMEVMTLGHLEDGTPIYFDRAAFESDGVLVVNRVKPHTCFRGPIESGLAKMIAIGLGKHQGATALHAHGFPRFAELIPRAAHLALERAPILGGLAIVENAYQEVAHLEAIPAAAILEREPELLAMARQRMGRLPVDRLDLLIVDEIGKEISGDGMDPNVTGRYAEPTMHGGPHVQKIVVLGLTAKTHGNASGIGMADVTTQQVLDAIDFAATYTNLATSTLLAGGRIPVVMPGPEEAVSLALRTLNGVTPDQARVIRIRNTLELERIWVSEPVWEELAGRGTGEPLSEPAPLAL
ncbi:MAG: DUF2088 domain-containing protein [Limnochordaceae bacterium]|nr:DUF2088 domain-containing protein [Limnochordaceae bacterium]